jgi:hypothetical protein
MGSLGQPDQSAAADGLIRDLLAGTTPSYCTSMTKRQNGKPASDDFIAPAKRAFRRVARRLRTENARLGLPLILGEQGKVTRQFPKLSRKIPRSR